MHSFIWWLGLFNYLLTRKVPSSQRPIGVSTPSSPHMKKSSSSVHLSSSTKFQPSRINNGMTSMKRCWHFKLFLGSKCAMVREVDMRDSEPQKVANSESNDNDLLDPHYDDVSVKEGVYCRYCKSCHSHRPSCYDWGPGLSGLSTDRLWLWY